MDAVRPGPSLVSLAYSRTNLSLSYQSAQTNSQAAQPEQAVKIDFSAEALKFAVQVSSGGAEQASSAGQQEDPQLAALLGSLPSLEDSAFSLLDQLSPDMRSNYLSLTDLIGGDEDWMTRFQKGINDLFNILWGGGQSASAPAASNSTQGAPASDDPDSSAATDGQGLMIGRYASFSMEAHMTAVYAASAEGDVEIREISVDLQVEATTAEVSQQTQNQMKDPLLLDLNRDGRISASGPQQGINFDIDGDGEQELTSFVCGADGALALDRDGDGKITSGRELFGDQNGAADGFQELGRYDENGDGVIDARDSVFNNLKVVTRGEDGSLSLHPLSAYDIRSITLGADQGFAGLGSAGYLNAFSRYTTGSGDAGLAADAMLAYTA